jgi:hypothetical protein
METITISKKEYRALKRAQRELERSGSVKQAGYHTPQHRKPTLTPQDFALLKLAERSFDFWNNGDDAIYDRL